MVGGWLGAPLCGLSQGMRASQVAFILKHNDVCVAVLPAGCLIILEVIRLVLPPLSFLFSAIVYPSRSRFQ
jgi:hypothetical protein